MTQCFKRVFLEEVLMGWIRTERPTNSANSFTSASVLWAFPPQNSVLGRRVLRCLVGHSHQVGVPLLEFFLIMENFQI